LIADGVSVLLTLFRERVSKTMATTWQANHVARSSGLQNSTLPGPRLDRGEVWTTVTIWVSLRHCGIGLTKLPLPQ